MQFPVQNLNFHILLGFQEKLNQFHVHQILYVCASSLILIIIFRRIIGFLNLSMKHFKNPFPSPLLSVINVV
jgi:hypothetical protein